MKFLFASLITGILVVGVVFGQQPGSAGTPEVSADRSLEEALALSGKNRSQLDEALASVPPGQSEGMEYLIRYMPERDLVTLDAKFLLSNSEASYAARNAHHWAHDVSLDIFYNDVLPYALFNEQREDWRSGFSGRFAPMVKDAKTLREAAVIVNKAIADEVKVEYSTKRKKPDQSPSESMKSGLASCTGLSILLCNALRSVGIPARIVGTPLWMNKKGNHNWVEFYDPVTDKWHFTEYYMDSKGIDSGWFVVDASKGKPGDYLHAIYANSWKPTGKCFPLVWDMDINYVPGIDVTGRYIEYGKPVTKLAEDKCELRIEFRDDEGIRKAASVQVYKEEKLIGEGVTPGRLADANEFFTCLVKRGGSYALTFEHEIIDGFLLEKIEVGENESMKIILMTPADATMTIKTETLSRRPSGKASGLNLWRIEK